MDNSNYNFFGLGIAPKIIDILSKLKFTNATPIQHQSIPLILEGKDVLGVAQTGTGKTMAFAIPTVQRLAQNPGKILTVVPTRELALQVEESFIKIARPFGLKTASLIGGDPIRNQLRSLSFNPRILIGTPGRLIDLMEQRKLHLSEVSVLILDEADRMLDMGFSEQIEIILKAIPKDRQTLLFSATMPSQIIAVVNRHMRMPVSVEVAPSGTKSEHVTHELFVVTNDMKRALLEKLLNQFRGSVLLFCRTKISAKRITGALRQQGHRAVEIHSDRTLGQRREALEGFKSGKHRILVATDIAARGIDVKGIELVVNYDLPQDAEYYVHRIGRTGRAGCPGHAISFATADQRQDVVNIEKLIKSTLPISKHKEIPTVEFDSRLSSSRSGPFRGGGGRRDSWKSGRFFNPKKNVRTYRSRR